MSGKNEQILMKGAEIIRMLGLGDTAGYRYLAHLQTHRILMPVHLPGLKTPRWRKDEVLELTNIRDKDALPCPDFEVHGGKENGE